MATNIAVALVMGLTLVGSIISPDLFVLPAYFGLGFPYVVAVNVAFLLFWIVLRNWFFLLSLSLLLFSVTEINDTLPLHIRKTAAVQTNQTVRILTYNTMMSGKLVKHTKKKPNKVIQYILDSDADILCLQEFTVSDNPEYITDADMNKIFRKYPYKHINYKLKLRSKRFGIATFSKFPIVNKKCINYASYGNISIYSDIQLYGQTIRLLNNHLESNRLTDNDKVMPIRLKDNFDADNLSGVTRHLSRKLGAGYKVRAKQADVVAKVIASSPYKVIVCGDFNDVPPSYTYTKVKGKLMDAFSEIGRGLGWTFNERYYHFRIDYVLYDSTAFTPLKYKMDRVKYSDHYPVICKLAMKRSLSE
jgi:endonuclease/exonuclease/phosphatase family metal-dependent hydrolase